jgi:hypothetical protein
MQLAQNKHDISHINKDKQILERKNQQKMLLGL